jgi:hypothetical protein
MPTWAAASHDPRKSGYVRIYRSLLGHPAFRNDAEAMAFAYLVMKACWRDDSVRYRNHRFTLSRGQLAMTIRDLAQHMDRGKGWVERLLDRLRNETMIETMVVNKILVITVCNYDEYQADPGTGLTPGETTDGAHARRHRDAEQVIQEPKQNSLPEGRVQPRRKILDEAVDALRDMGARRYRARQAVECWQAKYSDDVIIRTIEYARPTQGRTSPIFWTSCWLDDFAELEAARTNLSKG